MTPLPKIRHSHSRTHRRRSQDALTRTPLIECPSCHNVKLQHRVCPSCGNYRDAKVLEIKE